MPQLSLYLDNETMKLMQDSAELEQQSMSRFVARLIHEKLGNRWPAGYWELYGSVTDDSLQRPAELDFALDSPRTSL